MRTCTTALLLLLFAWLPACGGEPATELAGELAAERLEVRWNQSKPTSAVGRIRAAVIERPSPDRAWIEVQWEARSSGEQTRAACEIRIALPEGVVLVEGDSSVPLGAQEAVGTHRWLVEFPLGRPLDAVLRYCAETPRGPRAAEVAVRLTGDSR